MAKISEAIIEKNAKKGRFVVAVKLDSGEQVLLEPGVEFFTAAELESLLAKEVEAHGENIAAARKAERESVDTEAAGKIQELTTVIEGLRTELTNMTDQLNGHRSYVEAMIVENAELRLQLAAKPPEVREPPLAVEHQDIPATRTVDKLAPLDALVPAPTIDAPPAPVAADPDAPARPPGPGETSRDYGERPKPDAVYDWS